MNIVILGPQGSGKGTQAALLSQKYKLFYFEMGSFLRLQAKKNPLVDEYVNKKGKFVPEGISAPMALDYVFKKVKNKDNILFDGFPRSIKQLAYFDQWFKGSGKKLDLVINLDIAEKTTLKRLSARRMCVQCGKIYHLVNKPPKKQNTCDDCGNALYQREDDKPEAIKERLSWYKRLSAPLFKEFKKRNVLVEVDGERPIKEVFADLVAIISERGLS